MKRGRKEIGPRIGLRLPLDLLARIDAYAEGAGIGRAEAIRRLILASLG